MSNLFKYFQKAKPVGKEAVQNTSDKFTASKTPANVSNKRKRSANLSKKDNKKQKVDRINGISVDKRSARRFAKENGDWLVELGGGKVIYFLLNLSSSEI